MFLTWQVVDVLSFAFVIGIVASDNFRIRHAPFPTRLIDIRLAFASHSVALAHPFVVHHIQSSWKIVYVV